MRYTLCKIADTAYGKYVVHLCIHFHGCYEFSGCRLRCPSVILIARTGRHQLCAMFNNSYKNSETNARCLRSYV